MERTYGITDPEILTICDGERSWRGADQEWYGEEWQRKAGCGPTCAATLLRYVAEKRGGWEALYPAASREQTDFLALMDEVWKHVTPGKMGVNTLHIFTRGIKAYAAEKGVKLPVRELDIPALKLARPTVDQCAAFLRTGLSSDSPVAFLNLSAGEVKELDSWHWVTIIALEEHSEGPLLCTILDGGKEITVDFRLWFRTTGRGGGLIYLPGV
ncbi:MAG: hypothetical protein EOM52_09665 [Clostridia bacterium]|nr:hypothetical protein [Clostridia bacterium]